jgi:hypothetical protein
LTSTNEHDNARLTSYYCLNGLLREKKIAMADKRLLEKVHNLSDLELAALLCLVAREHCIISTSEDTLDELVEELQLVSLA